MRYTRGVNSTLPPQDSSAVSNVVQNESLPTDESAFNSDLLSPFLKGIILRGRLQHLIEQDEAQQILTGVEVVDLQTHHDIIAHQQDTEHFAASINKLPVTLLVLQDLRAGRLTMDQAMTWVPTDRRDGGGIYDVPGSSTQAPLRDVLFDMLNRSGNTAVRILVNYGLGGAAAVNDRWSHIPELSHTYLIPLDASRFFLGNSTPHDSLWGFEQVVRTPDSYGRFVKDALVRNIYTDVGTRSQLAGNDYIVLANKLGLLNDPDGDNRHDVGIIYNTRTHKSYGYAFLTTSPEANPAATPQAEQSLKDMGRATLRYAGDKPQPGRGNAAPFTAQSSKPENKILY